MAQYQYQEQEDLMADFDLPAKKEVHKLSARDRRSSRRKSKSIPSYKTEVRKPTLKPNFFKQMQASKAATKSKNVRESTINSGITTNIGEKTRIAGSADNGTVNYDMEYEDLEVFSPEAFAVMFSDVKKILSTMAEILSNFSMEDLLYSCTVVYQVLKETVEELVNYEEELKYITSAALLFYGGSWVFLAKMIAAVEVFETQEVLEEAWKVGTILISDDLEEYDVSPAKIKETLRMLGLHMALMIAITVSPAWAEICISVAFASKFSCLIPVKDMLKNNISSPAEEEFSELHEYFSIVDDSWFDLLSVIASNILSLTLFGCFPRLITAMYMGYLGVSITMKSLVHRLMKSDCVDFEMFDRVFGLNNTTQYYIWAIVAGVSLWQAMSDWTGICEFLSWLMFLHPIVQVFNTINADTE